MRSSIYVASGIVIAAALAACNQTVGECYPRGQREGATGTGAGIATSTGTGASGEGPPAEPQGVTYSEEECNAPEDDDSTEAALKVFCKTPDMGAVCSARCFEQAVPCVAFAVHPYKSDGGTGKLFSCNTVFPGYMCGYHFPKGDDCYFKFGFPGPPLCSYSGGD